MQNIIAIIWDFDKTLIKGYMQKPIFKYFDVDEKDFWNETNSLEEKYKEKGIRINKDTIYLNHFITCVQQGVFPELNNNMLKQFGEELEFYPGVPEIFSKLDEIISSNGEFEAFNIKIEHYIVSTGLAKVIEGSRVNQFVDGIWGCEFIETPIKSCLRIREYEMETQEQTSQVISQVSYVVDNTSKTRAIFEINKGVNKHDFDVNATIPVESRRIPFENMIYIADGPSDVPAFSVVKKNGGKTFAVYPQNEAKAFNQVNKLIEDGRISMFGEANYTEGTTTYLWLSEEVKAIANKIVAKYRHNLLKNVGEVPGHIIDEG